MAKYEVKDGVGIIPEGTTVIKYKAFENCAELTSVVIPEGVTEIEFRAFANCTGLTGIVIPASVTKLGWGLFNGCTQLASIKVAEGNPVYDSREDCNAIINTKQNELVAGCRSTVIPSTVTTIGVAAFCDCTGLTELVIPDSVTAIRGSAFRGCTGLTKLFIPASVTALEDYSYNNYGGIFFQPFVGCRNLTSIVVAEDNPVYDSRNNCNAVLKQGVNGLGNKVSTLIVGCASTVIPDDVNFIGECAFYGSAVTEVALPASIKEVRHGTFAYCEDLKSIDFGKTLEVVKGDDSYFGKPGAFQGCKSLEKLFFPASFRFMSSGAFYDCDSLISIKVDETNQRYDSREDCNAVISKGTNALILGCSTTVIPESVTEIEDTAFGHCNGLTEMTLHEGITIVGTQVFRCCEGLKSAAVLGPVKDLGCAFYGCKALETVTFGAGIKKMDEDMFDTSPALKAIYVPAKKAAYYKKRLNENVHGLIAELEPVKNTK